MGTKREPGAYDCFANALPDEPLFVLLARDPVAPDLLYSWAAEREKAIERGERPRNDYAMVVEARDCAQHMMAWRTMNDGKWRVPPAATDEMPSYRSIKKVRALQIAEFIDDPFAPIIKFQNQGFAPKTLKPEVVARYKPVAGDYYVVYGDGYDSISPGKAFSEGYVPL